MTGDREGRVEFEPVRIGTRRRGPDPVLIAIVLVVAGLVTATVKPWDEAPQLAGGPSPSPTPSATGFVPIGSPVTTAAPTPTFATPQILLDDPLATITVLSALEAHDGWGVRMVERAPDWRSGYRERWIAAPETPRGRRQARLGGPGPALVLGITTPADQTPLDVRVFLHLGPAGWEWLDVARVSFDLVDGAWLLRPPRIGGQEQNAWPPGRYRVDLLMGDRIERLDLTLQDPDGYVPEPTSERRQADSLVFSATVLEAYREPGPFLVLDWLAVPVPVVASKPLDDREAWFAGGPPVEGTFALVAEVHQPWGSAIGVMLPDGATRVRGSIDRLTPDAAFDAPEAVRRSTSHAPDAPEYLEFPAPDGEVWAPGTYAIHARWVAAGLVTDSTWHLTLLPGDPDPPPPLLAAARAFAPFAGEPGIILDPIDAAPGSTGPAPRRFSFVRHGADPSTAERIGCGWPGERIRSVIGYTHPNDDGPTSPVVLRLYTGGRAEDVPVRTIELPGLTLMGSRTGGTLASGVYRLFLGDTATGRTEVEVCLGTAPIGG